MIEREIVVDIGCGQKNNLDLYGYREEPTVGIDANKEFLLKRPRSLSNLVQADSAHLPIRDGVADRVYLIHTLEHVENFGGTLDEVARILKSGGTFAIAVPHKRYEKVMGAIETSYHSEKMHRRIVTKEDLNRETDKRGLNIVSAKTRGFAGAFYTTIQYIWHLRVLHDRVMEDQSGYLIGGNREKQSQKPSEGKFRGLRRLILSNTIIFGVMDKIYPFETYVEAVKSE